MHEVNATNRFDRYAPDISELMRQQAQLLPPHDPTAHSDDGLSSLARNVYYPLRLRLVRRLKNTGVYDALLRTHLLTGWFEEFRQYWVGELKNRPIDLPDFYFLRGVYRARFQDLALPNDSTDAEHLATWQQAELVYFLFHSQLRYRTSDFSQYLSFIPKGSHVCEYGCGIAPVTVWLARYAPHYALRLTFADIPTLAFHFARWRLAGLP
jgi:hypothetical protein